MTNDPSDDAAKILGYLKRAADYRTSKRIMTDNQLTTNETVVALELLMDTDYLKVDIAKGFAYQGTQGIRRLDRP